MKSTATILGLAAFLVGAVALTGAALTANPAKSTQLESAVRLGGHWYGEEIDLEKLKGRVVLYEFWGIN